MRDEQIESAAGQALAAFGQGTGAVRVSRATVHSLRAHFMPMFTEAVAAQWDAIAPQALERVRAMGRLAAYYATAAAETVIAPEVFLRAAHEVAQRSATEVCGDDPNLPQQLSAPRDEREVLLDQALVAFGQGTGPVRIARATVQALRDHFRPMLRPSVVAAWEELAPQALERVRAMGRLALLDATRTADTVISPQAFVRSAQAIEARSLTAICGGGDGPQVVAAAATGVDAIDPGSGEGAPLADANALVS